MTAQRTSLLGGPAPEDKRYELWMKDEKARFEAIGRSETAGRNARRQSRVRQAYQEAAAASGRDKQREAFGLQALREQGRLRSHW